VTKAFVRTFREINQSDVVSSGMFGDESSDQHPREWMKLVSICLEQVTAASMVAVLAQFYFLKQQLISCRFSTCLLL